jgi:tetratricopeptide (TPR) repeat protein
MRALALVSFLSLLPTPGTAADKQAEELQKLVQLPTLGGQVKRQFFDQEERKDPEAILSEIQRLEKGLAGNPADASSCERLADLLADLDERDRAEQMWKRAVELYRKRLQETPEDSALLAGLGHCLQRTRQDEEAEQVLRKAVRTGSRDWRCWLKLGDCLRSHSMMILLGPEAQGKVQVHAGIARAALNRLLNSGDRLATRTLADHAEALLQEAMKCYDEAVRVAPEEAEGYLARAFARWCRASVMPGISALSGVAVPLFKIETPPELVDDFRQAVRLRPDDPALRVGLCLFQVRIASGDEALQAKSKQEVQDRLPQKTKEAIAESLQAIEQISKRTTGRAAAEAWLAHAQVSLLLLKDHEQTVASAEKAVEADPHLEAAWEMLLYVHTTTLQVVRFKDCCERRAKVLKTPRTFLFLAKVQESSGDLDAAEKTMREATRLHPQDGLLNLGLAAILLERRTDPDTLKEVSSLLDQAGKARSPDNDRDSFYVNFLLLRGIHQALSGDKAKAKDYLSAAQDKDPEDQAVRSALMILGP